MKIKRRKTLKKLFETFLGIICGIITGLLILKIIIWTSTLLGVIQPEVIKPDGELYLHVGNQTQTIYLGHEAIITLCRGGYERGYEDYKNITCEERFEGCGAVNCECWVND